MSDSIEVIPSSEESNEPCPSYLNLNGAFTSIPNGVKVYIQGFAKAEFIVERSYFAQSDRYGSFVIYFDLKLDGKTFTVPQSSITGIVPAPVVDVPTLPNGGE